MAGLKNLHKIVARELVAGISLRDICHARQLSYTSWCKIVGSTMFQAEQLRLQALVEEDFLDAMAEDPVMTILRHGAPIAAQSLVDEASSDEDTASPGSRIAASKEILNQLGYGGKRENVPVININLSKNKMEIALGEGSLLSPQPDTIDEHTEEANV